MAGGWPTLATTTACGSEMSSRGELLAVRDLGVVPLELEFAAVGQRLVVTSLDGEVWFLDPWELSW